MKAMVLTQFGDASNFTLTDIPAPDLRPGTVLIDVKAASVNPVDYKVRQNGPGFANPLPAPLGLDVAGTIRAVAPDITGFAVGDAVYGCAGGIAGETGTNAEIMRADTRLIAPMPVNLSFREAAALPLVSITAIEALERLGVGVGTRLLVIGGTGGVGHIAVQLAAARGAIVDSTASTIEKSMLAKSFGAREVISYRTETIAEGAARLTQGEGYDCVLDATGGSDIASAFAAARLNGQVATIVSHYTADLAPMHVKGLSLHVIFMLIPLIHNRGREQHGAWLRDLTKLVEAGRVKPFLDPQRFALADLAAAHTHLESGQAVGKVVIDIAE
ncbi:zinc-dependent alcohol dehydrogenase family protein [Elstera sp.]|uniref:zinc-dependent alcohol dehydrogenase family protein n=1 Tax=Elstera sp. TaxID=1916664 RepID=UPI0037C04A77